MDSRTRPLSFSLYRFLFFSDASPSSSKNKNPPLRLALSFFPKKKKVVQPVAYQVAQPVVYQPVVQQVVAPAPVVYAAPATQPVVYAADEAGK